MQIPKKRSIKTIEYVIDTSDYSEGIDAKEFTFQYNNIIGRMENEDGVDFSYDDAFRVRAVDGEIIFSFTGKKK